MEATAGPLSKEIGTLVKLLLERKRVELIPALADASTIWRAFSGASSSQRDHGGTAGRRRIAGYHAVAQRASSGNTVEIRKHVDPEIIGGIVARIGDQLIDASVRGASNHFAASLLRPNIRRCSPDRSGVQDRADGVGSSLRWG